MGRPSNSADRRAQIVNALIAVMAKHGYDGASIADVAHKAGLTPGLVHYHFANKLEILVESIRTIAAEHETALETALAACATPREELTTFIDVHLGTGAHASPTALACWVLILAEALREKRVRIEVERVLERLAARVIDILERGTAARQLSCDDIPAAAAAIVSVIQGYFSVAATARDLIPSGTAAASTLRMVEGLLR